MEAYKLNDLLNDDRFNSEERLSVFLSNLPHFIRTDEYQTIIIVGIMLVTLNNMRYKYGL